MENLEREFMVVDDFSGDETTPLAENVCGTSNRNSSASSPIKKWDVFQNPPPKEDSGSMRDQSLADTIMKIFKVFMYILTFTIVLGGGLISKGTMLLMTSQLRPHRSVPICKEKYGADKDFTFEIPDLERIQWIWCLLFAYLVPELETLFRSSRICMFKSWKKPMPVDFLLVFVCETFHTLGLAILVFMILPELDIIKGLMLTNCVCIVPGILGLMSRSTTEPLYAVKVVIDVLAILAQATSFFVWPLVDTHNARSLWLIPLSVFLISFAWWENYVDRNSPLRIVREMARVSERLQETRYFSYIFISIWKMMLFFMSMLLLLYVNNENIGNLFQMFSESFNRHHINATEVQADLPGRLSDLASSNSPVHEATYDYSWANAAIYTLLIQVGTTWLCYVFGKFACKICIQGFSFAFPISLTVPAGITFLIAACGVRNEDACFMYGQMPPYLYWECPLGNFLDNFISQQHAYVWLFWLFSQTWITLHIWAPKCERLATTEKLFAAPMYSAFLVDQSLAMNRRKDDDDEGEIKKDDMEKPMDHYYTTKSKTVLAEMVTDAAEDGGEVRKRDKIPRIYACATMWHETREEMMEMLKSIMRMDSHHSAMRNAQELLKVVVPDYYEFETHIFFDDAFVMSEEDETENSVNIYVKDFMRTTDEAASHVHGLNLRVRPPTAFPTPYGGRLEWTLPGKTKMIVHLKNKAKIRHRKRWSQVMYMYYLLGHKLMELPLAVERKAIVAENTFLLALDGDIDFQPDAVHMLIDLMKKNRNLGAACGRIHPIGAGPMVWYQKFEYAIGHWMQKATEHVIGCVLCSPGCFSLFRAVALMDKNVMAKYTIKPEKARDYVQYDQGEDRWLCTLLLQRGYRVEYSAASDAYTHAPEGFNEFYNQRRRWVPSTMANIMDLLMDYKRTVVINDNISMPYVSYQIMLMVGTILGPGTIFLMLVGAFVAAFNIDQWSSFQYNVIPILLFMVICYFFESKFQLFVAQVLSTFYALVMVAVLVGIILEITRDGILAPSSLSMFFIIMVFVITAIMHPKEFSCLMHGFLYLCVVPSMYLLLMIYSLFNLNNVTWGTREAATKKSKEEVEKEKREAEEAKKAAKKTGLLGFLNQLPGNGKDEEGSIEFSLAGLFKVMCCTHEKPVDEKKQLLRIADSMETLTKRMDSLERNSDPQMMRRKSMSGRGLLSSDHLASLAEEAAVESQEDDETDKESVTEPRTYRDDLKNPYWIEDKSIRIGAVDYISTPEIQFWDELIKKYLHPIDENKEQRKKLENDLKELRDFCVFAFIMMNSLFVTIVFLLQLNKDMIHVQWPLGVKVNMTYAKFGHEVTVNKEYLQLEPIGLVFVFFFALIMIIQFVAMFIHRKETFAHILSLTRLDCCKNKQAVDKDGNITPENAVEAVHHLQQMTGLEDDDEPVIGRDRLDRRKTIQQLDRQQSNNKKVPIGNLDAAVRKRLNSLVSGEGAGGSPSVMRHLSLRRDTLHAVAQRRSSVLEKQRRMSQFMPGRQDSRSSMSVASRNSIGITNQGFQGDDEQRRPSSSIRMQNMALMRAGSRDSITAARTSPM